MWQRYKEIKHAISLVPTVVFGDIFWAKWSRISENLYLSKLPFRNDKESLENFAKKNQEEYKDQPIGLVVSVTENYEVNKPVWILGYILGLDPIRKDEWEAKDIQHLLLDMEDFTTTVDLEKAVKALIRIQANREQKKAVLIHCKAGRSRSPMMVACVLAVFDVGLQTIHKEKNAEELVGLAIKIIEKERPHINLASGNINTAIKIVDDARKLLRENPNAVKEYIEEETKLLESEEKKITIALKKEVDACIRSPEIKEQIMGLDSYRKLVEYKEKLLKEEPIFKSILGQPERAKHINRLIISIDEAKDSQWYKELVQLTGPLNDLISATPYWMGNNIDEDQAIRESLVKVFKADIEKLLFEKIKQKSNCSFDDFHEIFSFPVGEKIAMSPRR